MNVVGLGSAGCAIASKFAEYPEYKIFCIDTEDKNYGDSFVKIKKQKDHEQYEANHKSVKLKLENVPVLFILSGAGDISGACLRILEDLKGKKINILYIKPDETSLGAAAKLKHRLIYQVLQQYTRSAVFENICTVDNALVEKLTKQISITNYWDSLNELIARTYHMINIFNNTEPLLTTFSSSPPPITAKMNTLGYVDYKSKEEKLFYDLKYPRMKMYYFAINSAELESNKELLHEIRAFIKDRKEKKVDVAFSIYSTVYEQNYIYSVHHASLIQEENLNL